MNKVADIIGVARIRVYEVATFYTMFNRYVAVVVALRWCVRVVPGTDSESCCFLFIFSPRVDNR
jgi:NADH:ubiquinone oxidoreductase subunit E